MSSVHDAPKTSTSKKPVSKLLRFKIHPRLHPRGLKLEVTDSHEHLIYYLVYDKSTPSRHKIRTPDQIQPEQLIIKALPVGSVQRYILLAEGKELLSLRQLASPSEYTVRDAYRKHLAQFLSLNPEKILLRTRKEIIGRLRYRLHPNPIGFILDCEIAPGKLWLLATIIYTVAQTEIVLTKPDQTLETDVDEEDTAP